MTNNIVRTPDSWRNYSTKVPIAAFRLRKDDLKRIYHLIDMKQRDYRDKILSTLTRQESESEKEFLERRQRVYNAFVTSVTVTGINDEMIHANNESLFDSVNMPEQIRSIFISTKSAPLALSSATFRF